MKTKDRLDNLEAEVKNLAQLYKCLNGKHDLSFYDIGESSIPNDYYIRHVCSGCNKLFQRSLTSQEMELLLMEKLK